MEENYTLKIDPETKDIVLDDEGIIETISGDATTGQNVRLTLEVYKGEFPFDPTHGTDYDRIMGKKRSELEDDEVPEVVREAIFQEPNVSEVDHVDYELNGRSLGISVTGTLTNGNSITTEVNTR